MLSSLLLAAFGSILSSQCTSAWVVSPATTRFPAVATSRTNTQRWTSTSEELAPTAATSDDDDEEEDWEYVEFESLTETDLIGSEWLVGTCWDDKADKIDETWCRLVTTEKGENLAVWGDNKEGKWALDVATQYVTISKNYVWGKQIWAALVEDYYFLAGTVRGWTYVSAACVEAQWQAKRLGVDPEEAGTAPWFEEDDEEESATDEASAGLEMSAASESSGAAEVEETPAVTEEEN